MISYFVLIVEQIHLYDLLSTVMALQRLSELSKHDREYRISVGTIHDYLKNTLPIK